MQTKNKRRNSQFMIAKEVFIEHILSQIEDHYELSSNCLGQGGFGQVFEGRKKRNLYPHNSKEALGQSFSSFQTSSRCYSDQQNTSEPRAIKRISYKRPSDKQLMINEMEILSYLDHPLIVKLYETFEHKKNLYLVIDLLKGGDLFTVITQNTKLSELQTKIIFRQLIKAINYLHTQHICHRDLKLENIMFLNKQDFNIKLVDFGLAFCWDDDMRKQIREKQLHNKMTGTPDYMSPEMLTQDYDERCDIWSAGVILYILLSGQAPFQAQTTHQITQRIRKLDYTFDSTFNINIVPEFEIVSESAKDLIKKILKPQNERISLQEIFQHPWFKDDSSQGKSEVQISSMHSVTLERKPTIRGIDFRRKVNTSASVDKDKRKSSLNISQEQETQSSNVSYCSEDLIRQEGKYQLTVTKLKHYTKLSMLQKLQAIFAVSKLSQTRTKAYGEEFLEIDKDNDGTISFEDFIQNLEKTQSFVQGQEIEAYFNEVALSQRGSISYSEYLACVLAYQGDHMNIVDGQILEFDQRLSEIGKASFLSEDDTVSELIDIFDDSMLFDLFCLLDKNTDGLVSKQDFLDLLEKNGIQDQNTDFIDYLTRRLNENENSQKREIKKKESKGPWFVDHRTYKDQLSRTYKGESDGGILIDFKSFRHLMKGSQA